MVDKKSQNLSISLIVKFDCHLCPVPSFKNIDFCYKYHFSKKEDIKST